MEEQVYIRPQAVELRKRLKEPRQFIQSITGARQVGKTTLARQVAEQSRLPYHFASADEPTLQDGHRWITSQWEEARRLAEGSKRKESLLILDEVQKISQWSSTVKGLWDEDTHHERSVKVVLLGSSPLLMGKGLTESLAGRFETLRLPHWSFSEMNKVFGWDLQQYFFYGAYPGSASLIDKPQRWARYIMDSLIETTISRDVLLLSRINKPALLRRLFELGCAYSGQIISYSKIAGELQEKGNVTTLADYLDLLSGSGTLTGLRKYSGNLVSVRRSIPKMQVFNTALITAQSGKTMKAMLADSNLAGRLIESAVGAHLLNACAGATYDLFYWRENNHEVDYVLRRGDELVAIEVKSGRKPSSFSGLNHFEKQFKPVKSLIVGTGGIPLETFFTTPIEYWFERGSG